MSFTLTVHDGIADIGAAAWDACAARTGDPFVSYDFLHACEASGSAVPTRGWAPRHLALRNETGTVLGVMPLYLKGDSQGEYVFDHSWADAFERAGGRYYPKLLGAVPFTPATGPRFLSHPDADAATVREALLQGALALVERLGVSSLHVNFPTETEWQAMGALEEVPFLHFELCYYQAIEFAISRGLSRVEAGAQGEHKIARGYLPAPVWSAHHIAHPGLREAVAHYLEGERPAVAASIAELTAQQSPYRSA